MVIGSYAPSNDLHFARRSSDTHERAQHIRSGGININKHDVLIHYHSKISIHQIEILHPGLVAIANDYAPPDLTTG